MPETNAVVIEETLVIKGLEVHPISYFYHSTSHKNLFC